jgi:hypothetical protein
MMILINLWALFIYCILEDIATAKGLGSTPSVRGKAAGAVRLMMSFDFVFTSIVPVLMPQLYFRDAHENNQTLIMLWRPSVV